MNRRMCHSWFEAGHLCSASSMTFSILAALFKHSRNLRTHRSNKELISEKQSENLIEVYLSDCLKPTKLSH